MSTLYTESAGGIITNGNNEVVLFSQYGTSWSLPKGHVEAGENLVQTAYREIHEETGIDSLTLVKTIVSYVMPRLEVNGSQNPKEIKTIHLGGREPKALNQLESIQIRLVNKVVR